MVKGKEELKGSKRSTHKLHNITIHSSQLAKVRRKQGKQMTGYLSKKKPNT